MLIEYPVDRTTYHKEEGSSKHQSIGTSDFISIDLPEVQTESTLADNTTLTITGLKHSKNSSFAFENKITVKYSLTVPEFINPGTRLGIQGNRDS